MFHVKWYSSDELSPTNDGPEYEGACKRVKGEAGAQRLREALGWGRIGAEARASLLRRCGFYLGVAQHVDLGRAALQAVGVRQHKTGLWVLFIEQGPLGRV